MGTVEFYRVKAQFTGCLHACGKAVDGVLDFGVGHGVAVAFPRYIHARWRVARDVTLLDSQVTRTAHATDMPELGRDLAAGPMHCFDHLGPTLQGRTVEKGHV